MFKRQKWFKLTVGSGFDRHTVPIFKACAGNREAPLFKTLMSSYCQNNCKFCAFRSERRVFREKWEPLEFAKIAFKLRKMGKIEGVFLSSSVERDPDFIVERQIRAIEILRRMGFKDYVHLKLMPSVSRELIKRAVEISDRVGVNVELPGSRHYEDMKLYLTFKRDVVKRLRWAAKEVEKAQKEGKCKAGLDSQMIIGTSDETDKEIIEISSWLHNELNARRVYYSRFNPVKGTPLEGKKPENPWREYRLYQSSFLLRDYGFKDEDFVFDDSDNLNLGQDPKFSIASEMELRVDVNEAKFEDLIKVPGIGLKTAEKIIKKRPIKDEKDLKSSGVIIKRATPFIEIDGIHQRKLSHWT